MRAREVVSWLMKHGIDERRLVAKGCGSSRSLWAGHTEEQRAANRRAELVRHSERDRCKRPSSFLDFPVAGQRLPTQAYLNTPSARRMTISSMAPTMAMT